MTLSSTAIGSSLPRWIRVLKASTAVAVSMVCGINAVHAQNKSLERQSAALVVGSQNKYTMTVLNMDTVTDMNAAGLIVGADDGKGAVYINGAVSYLAAPVGYTQVVASAVSSDGKIVGYGTSGRDTRALYWDSYTSAARDMGGVSNYTIPLAVNASGVVVGYSKSTNGGLEHAFRWTLKTGYQDIHMNGYLISQAFGIANSGYIAGFVNGGLNEGYAARWYPNGAKGTIARGIGYRAFDDGRVLGSLHTDRGDTATMWDVSNTATFVGPSPQTHSVNDISGNGRLVGGLSVGNSLAWTTLNGSSITYLPIPPNTYSIAKRVSACGAILGAYYGNGTAYTTVLWTRMTCDQPAVAGAAR